MTIQEAEAAAKAVAATADPGVLRWIGDRFYDGAAYLVAILIGLVYTQTREKANADKAELQRQIERGSVEIKTLRESMDKMISKDDFTKHEEREERDREERRAAESKLFDKLDALAGKVHELIGRPK